MLQFFKIYGGKFKLAPRLPLPIHDHVIECFAGSAGYSCFHAERLKRVTLVERDEVIAGIWGYLLTVSRRELMRLPVNIQSVDELPARTPEAARNLIGYWFNDAIERPAVRRSQWARALRWSSKHWSATIRARIAAQLPKIQGGNWKIIQGDYSLAPDIPHATTFVDPPYSSPSGKSYRYSNALIDYYALAKWCRSRRGQVIACENSSNTGWLPFGDPYGLIVSRRGEMTEEVVWTNARL